jgi:hypothetical protein
MNNTQIKALLASYVRSVLGAAIALYLSGVTDLGKLSLSLVAALVPVATRALNPKDKAFGIVPTVAEVDAALANAKNANTKPIVDGIKEIKKLVEPAKKPVAKKPVDKKTPPKK